LPCDDSRMIPEPQTPPSRKDDAGQATAPDQKAEAPSWLMAVVCAGIMAAVAAGLAWHQDILGHTSVMLDLLGRWAPIPLLAVGGLCLWGVASGRSGSRLSRRRQGLIGLGAALGAALMVALDGPLEDPPTAAVSDRPSEPGSLVLPSLNDPAMDAALERVRERQQDPAVRAASAAIARYCEPVAAASGRPALFCVLSFGAQRPTLEEALRDAPSDDAPSYDAFADRLVACAARYREGGTDQPADHPWDPEQDCAPPSADADP